MRIKQITMWKSLETDSCATLALSASASVAATTPIIAGIQSYNIKEFSSIHTVIFFLLMFYKLKALFYAPRFL